MSAPATAARGSAGLSRGYLRLTRLVAAAAVVGWTLWLTVVYLKSASEKLTLGGYFGARDARHEFAILMSVGAGFIVLAALAPSRKRTFPLLTVMAAGIAGMTLAFTSGSVRGVLATGVMMIWSALVGEACLRLLGLNHQRIGGWGRTAMAIALGLGTLSHGIFVLGLLGIINDAGFGLLFGGGALGAAVTLRRRPRDGARAVLPTEEGAADDEPGNALVEYVSLALIALVLVASFGASLAPQTEFDSLMYHLSLPRIFLEAGRLVQRPDIQGSQLPLGMELTYVPAMRFGGEVAANLMSWALVPAIAALFWSAGNRFFGRPVGAIAAALFCLMPLVFYESTIAYTDLAMTFYVAAGAYCLALTADKPSWGLATAAGLFAGLAISFKLVAAVYVIPQAFFFLVLTVGRRKRRIAGIVRDLTPYGLAAVVTGAPWLALHWVQLSNPVFPLLNNVFHSKKWVPVSEGFGLYGIGTGWKAFLTIWWKVSSHPVGFAAPAADWMIGLPLLMSLGLLIAWPILSRRRAPLAWTLLAFGSAVSWFLLAQHTRYGLPVFALAAVPAGGVLWGSARCLSLVRDFAALGLVGLLALWFASGLAVGFSLLRNVPGHYPVDFLLGKESREEYTRRVIPNYDALKFVDAAMKGTDDQAVNIGDPYNYFVSNPMWYMQTLATLSPFARVINAGGTADEVAAGLLKANIRWMVVDANRAPIWLKDQVLSPQFIETHTELEFAKNGVSVYRIVSSPQQTFSANLLCNADFESTDQQPGCWVASGDARIETSNTPGGRGDKAVITSVAGAMTQVIPVCPNTLYHLSELARSDARGGAARVQMNWLDKAGKHLPADLRAVSVESQWKSYELAARAPAGAAYAEIYATAHSGVVWLDGFEFRSVVSRYSAPCNPAAR